jgi:heat shock protein HslJ
VLVQTSWTLTSWTLPNGARRALPQQGQPVTMAFTRQQGQAMISGNAGCNRYTGQYVLAQNGLLTFPYPLVATRMACLSEDASRLEHDFLAGMPNITSSRLDDALQPRMLTLTLRSGDVLNFQRGSDPAPGS